MQVLHNFLALAYFWESCEVGRSRRLLALWLAAFVLFRNFDQWASEREFGWGGVCFSGGTGEWGLTTSADYVDQVYRVGCGGYRWSGGCSVTVWLTCCSPACSGMIRALWDRNAAFAPHIFQERLVITIICSFLF